MTGKTGPGRCEEVVRSSSTYEKRKMLRCIIWSSRPTCKVLASGEIPKDSLGRSWPGNRVEVVEGDSRVSSRLTEWRTIRRNTRNVASPVLLGRVVGHPWSGAGTFGEVR